MKDASNIKAESGGDTPTAQRANNGALEKVANPTVDSINVITTLQSSAEPTLDNNKSKSVGKSPIAKSPMLQSESSLIKIKQHNFENDKNHMTSSKVEPLKKKLIDEIRLLKR